MSELMFYDALENDTDIADYALPQFGLLYDIEREVKQLSLTATQIMEVRKEAPCYTHCQAPAS
jgi:hypothetical protein